MLKKKDAVEGSSVEDENVENFYSEDARSLLLEEDEISPEEAAFMKGYDEAG